MARHDAEHRRRHRSWSRPADVDPASAVAEQLRLIRALAAGTTAGPAVEHAWFAARRASLAAGERTHGPLAKTLDDVFFLAKEYVADPSLRDGPHDLDDAQLLAGARETLDRLDGQPG